MDINLFIIRLDNGDPVEDENTGWHKGLSDCIENHGTYFLKDFRQQCSLVEEPSWTNIFRQHYSFQYEIHTLDDISNPNSTPFTTRKHSSHSGIIGGVVAGIIFLLVLFTLFICRNRKITYGDHQRFENNDNPDNHTTKDEFSNSKIDNYVMRDHETYGRCKNQSINKLNNKRSRQPVSFNPLHAQVCVSKQNIP
ncbi:unnamed protein product [Mytilus coruscus]|uniref:Uncharacterized protein n=1 Tax=Mytilus coruscus TaxID=42192 RepID=A0A6J8EKS3_MYTCO|nr:unnamed protein product [Mytilus coruscus]